MSFHRHRGISLGWKHEDVASPLRGTLSNLLAIRKHREPANAENIARVKNRHDESVNLQTMHRRNGPQGLADTNGATLDSKHVCS